VADCGCAERHEDGARAVDSTAWDGNAAISTCAKANSPASCYGSICAGRKSGDPSLQASWALPHHKTAGGPPNAAGVRAALGRVGQTQGLTNAAAARRHLEAHMRAISGSDVKSDEHPTANLVRGVYPLQMRDDGTGAMPTLHGHFAVFDEWTEIDSFFEGRFMERLDPASMDRTFAEERDGMRVLFQHGRDPQVGMKPLGPINVLEAQKAGAYYEAPMLDTSYNRDLLPGLRAKQYGASFRFSVLGEKWDRKPPRSKHNPDGLPERTITDASVMEFGPVTFPAYKSATAGVRSLTDDYLLSVLGGDPDRARDLIDHLTGMPGARSAAGEEHDDRPGNGVAPHPFDDPEALRLLLRAQGVQL